MTVFSVAALVGVSTVAHAQQMATDATTAAADEEAAGTDAVSEPVYKDYRGVSIGMKADEVQKKLGKPQSGGKTQDFFLVSDNEIVQVFYDQEGKVNAVSVTYTGKGSSAPTADKVLGSEVEADANGRTYKLVRYPSAGYWVAYSRSAGDTPVVSITMRRMRAAAK